VSGRSEAVGCSCCAGCAGVFGASVCGALGFDAGVFGLGWLPLLSWLALLSWVALLSWFAVASATPSAADAPAAKVADSTFTNIVTPSTTPVATFSTPARDPQKTAATSEFREEKSPKVVRDGRDNGWVSKRMGAAYRAPNSRSRNLAERSARPCENELNSEFPAGRLHLHAQRCEVAGWILRDPATTPR